MPLIVIAVVTIHGSFCTFHLYRVFRSIPWRSHFSVAWMPLESDGKNHFTCQDIIHYQTHRPYVFVSPRGDLWWKRNHHTLEEYLYKQEYIYDRNVLNCKIFNSGFGLIALLFSSLFPIVRWVNFTGHYVDDVYVETYIHISMQEWVEELQLRAYLSLYNCQHLIRTHHGVLPKRKKGNTLIGTEHSH